MFQILVAEDDKSAGRLIMDTLSDAGYEPVLAADGLQAYAMLTQRHVDLLVLDLMLPELDGFALLHQLRESGSTLPVLVLTAREAIADKRRGLRAGADDYMVKPADEEELLLRIAALLRRSRQACEHRLVAGGTTLNYDDLAAESQGVRVELSRKEFLLLYKLLSCPGKTFTPPPADGRDLGYGLHQRGTYRHCPHQPPPGKVPGQPGFFHRDGAWAGI